MSYVLAMQIVFACINWFTHLMSLAVLLRLQAVREDHFREISSERLSDGPIVSSSSLKHVRHHSDGHWPTSVREVHWGHTIACGPRRLQVHMVVLLATS